MTNRYNFSNVDVEYLRENCEGSNETNDRARVWHDDGAMGIVYRGTSYYFMIGQEVSRSEYNRQANNILRESGVVGPRVSGDNN